MPVVKPEYTLTDKDLTDLESFARSALEDLTKYAPVDTNNQKVPVAGIRSTQKILSMCASLRESIAGLAPKDPATELAELQEELRKNLEWQESHRLDPKTNQRAKDSVRKGIERTQKRIAELNVELGAIEPEPEGAAF